MRFLFRMVIFPPDQRPVFDAAEEGFRIQDSVVRILKKPRRQKPVVGFAGAAADLEASKPGSWQPKVFGVRGLDRAFRRTGLTGRATPQRKDGACSARALPEKAASSRRSPKPGS